MAAKSLGFGGRDFVIILMKMYSWSNGNALCHAKIVFFLSLNMSIIKSETLTLNKLGRTSQFSHFLHDALKRVNRQLLILKEEFSPYLGF